MDGESSYESDTSESWSLIDINLNEESVSLAKACSELENSPQTDVKREKLKVTNETELEDFVRKCKEINKTDFRRVSDSDSDSDASFKNRGLPTCRRIETDGIDSPFKRSSDNDGTQDSGDTESIEILDVTDSELCVDHLDFPTYHSNYEESSEENIDSESRNSNLSVIKRRRRRVSRSPEDGVHSVNSENRSSADNNSTFGSADTGREIERLCVDSNRVYSHPVYKHYRNNVANTILSLSVGVIFAGVACIAIGHFLGVQDAAETAVELAETLKKLQVENAALQSRLSHLNRALLTREVNSKLELPLNEPQDKAARERDPHMGPDKGKQTDLNNAALSEIRSSLNSIELLSKLQAFVQKNNKVTDTEHGIDFNVFGKYIHDQLHTLNARQEEGAKFLEDTDRKISKVLQKIINRLSSSQDHIQKLYERLIKLKNKLNHKMKRIFPEASREMNSERSEFKNRVPVTELDLQNWDMDDEFQKRSDRVNSEPCALYKFPQLEEYYVIESDLKDTSEKEFELTNSSKILSDKESGKVVNENKGKNKREGEKIEKKHSKDNLKKKKLKEKETKEKKKDKRRKRDGNKMQKVVKNPEGGQRNKEGIVDSQRKKFTDNRNVFSETMHQNKTFVKRRDRDIVSKLITKKMKNSKLKKVLLSKPKKGSYFRRNYSHACPGPHCFNLTAEWIFKWAGGREEMRKHQKLGEWQFDRAKARKDMRDYGNENWQFRRATGRENNRNDVRWQRRKYERYAGKDFFHEGFSWI